MSIQTHLPTLRTWHRNFMSIRIMWNFNTEAIPGPSDEKLLKSKNYKKDPSIEPSEVIYMQIKEK